jgi:Fe-S cluster assembly protein SufD
MSAKIKEIDDLLIAELLEDQPKASPLLSMIYPQILTKLKAVGFPTRKAETYRYVPLTPFYNIAWKRPTPYKNEEIQQRVKCLVDKESQHSYLVCVDGTFSPELSDVSALDPSIVLLPYSQASRTYGFYMQSRLMQKIQAESDPFALLNLYLAREGVFLYVPAGIEQKTPLQIIHVVTGESTAVSPQLLGFVGENSRLEITSRIDAPENVHWMNALIDLNIEKDAHVSVHKDLLVPEGCYVFEKTVGELKQDASLEITSVTSGSKTVRQDYDVALNGEKSSVDLKGVWMCSESNQAHVNALVRHRAENCRSNQHFKGVLKGHARASFEGKIDVDSVAQGTEAYQLNNNLILSEEAATFAKPNLEIRADEVSASHGVTMARLSEDELFYCATRGLSENAAKSYLVKGFCAEMVEQINFASAKHRAVEYMQRVL